MIIVKLLGIDQYQAEDYVRALHTQFAQIFETEEKDILFYAPDSYLIHKGIEQTSYIVNIEIEAPEKYKPLENKASEYIAKLFMNQICVHVRVTFNYFDEDREHVFINEDYPLYMTDENMAHFDTEDEDSEPYLGNAFEDYDKKVEEKEKEQGIKELERLKSSKK
jgi:hypothetical protein